MRDQAVRVAADALLQAWPREEQDPWLTDSLRCCAASLQQAAGKHAAGRRAATRCCCGPGRAWTWPG